MKNYIIKNNSLVQERMNRYFYGKPINIVNPFTNSIDLKRVIQKLESYVPSHLTHNLDGIYVGDFTDFKKNNRDVNASYKDGGIFVSNEQDNEEDLIDDIVHEIAHSLEREYKDHLYGDERLESEFLAKRKTLYYLLDDDIKKRMVDFLDSEYSESFDMFLYKTLGYDYLRTASASLFYSPYGITSLREYWADGFENYFLGDRRKLKELSPVLYNKIVHMVEENH